MLQSSGVKSAFIAYRGDNTIIKKTKRGIELIFQTRDEERAFYLFQYHADLNSSDATFSLVTFENIAFDGKQREQIQRFISEVANAMESVQSSGNHPSKIRINTEHLLNGAIPNFMVGFDFSGNKTKIVKTESCNPWNRIFGEVQNV